MTLPVLDPETVARVVAAALNEDLGARGDVTSEAVVVAGMPARGRIATREPIVVSGIPVATAVFAAVDPSTLVTVGCPDGADAAAGSVLLEVAGEARSLLAAERTALNFLQRMSGIATAARAAVNEIAGTGARILDTRKTAPGLRSCDKYAVACGGALNHRFGLHDGVLIKDTHLAVVGSIAQAVGAARARGHAPATITVEVRTPSQLGEAIASGAGRALLDNMDRSDIEACVSMAKGRIVLEASGGLRPGGLREVARLGVDFLSVGWLTHSARAVDIAMEMEPRP